jgi:heat shock protein HtpX
MAKWMAGVEVIDPDTTKPIERQLLQLVRQLVKKAGLPRMPEVGIYESEEVNAFATGPTKSRALVAVSSGLLDKMDWVEIEGVLGHEISHVANGDMVTLTLLQGVVNAFVMFFARVLAFAVTRIGKGREDDSRSSPFLYGMLVFLFEVVFMILGSMVIACFSRFREYRADEGGARLAGKQSMIQALCKLQTVSALPVPQEAQQNSAFQAFKISGKKGFLWLFATHPPLEDRIARLEGKKV